MEVLTPASPSDLPPLGEPVADEPSWRYPSATTAGAGAEVDAEHLPVLLLNGELGPDGVCHLPIARTGST
jgi:hypothetical protein